MKQTRTVRQSIVVSAVLLSVLFFLPLAVIEPFRAELFITSLPCAFSGAMPKRSHPVRRDGRLRPA